MPVKVALRVSNVSHSCVLIAMLIYLVNGTKNLYIKKQLEC